jgi:hypothetical protein
MLVKNYVILNPSANLLMIGLVLRELGHNVYFFNTKELPLITPNSIHLIYKDVFLTYLRQSSVDNTDNFSMLVNKGLLNKYKLRRIKKELSKIDGSLANGGISTLMLYKRGRLIKYNMGMRIVEFDTIKDINTSVGNKIITNIVPYIYIRKYIKTYEILSIYSTDFDLIESFGKDYYICFIENEKIEFYVFNNHLCIIHKNIMNPEYLLYQKFPFLHKFITKRIEYMYINRNPLPWIESYKKSGITLVNDYSFGGLSIKMCDKWYENIGRQICTGMP